MNVFQANSKLIPLHLKTEEHGNVDCGVIVGCGVRGPSGLEGYCLGSNQKCWGSAGVSVLFFEPSFQLTPFFFEVDLAYVSFQKLSLEEAWNVLVLQESSAAYQTAANLNSASTPMSCLPTMLLQQLPTKMTRRAPSSDCRLRPTRPGPRKSNPSRWFNRCCQISTPPVQQLLAIISIKLSHSPHPNRWPW